MFIRIGLVSIDDCDKELIFHFLERNFGGTYLVKCFEDFDFFLRTNEWYQIDIFIVEFNAEKYNFFTFSFTVSDYQPGIIFLISEPSERLPSHSLAVLDFLIKPIHEQSLLLAINRFTALLRSGFLLPVQTPHLAKDAGHIRMPDKIALPTTRGLTFYNINDIVRCEAQNNYTQFYFKNKSEELVCRTLKEYEDKLSDKGFFRVHKSHLINLNFMTRYIQGEGGSVIMDETDEIPVSRRMKQPFLEYIGKMMRF